MKPTSLVIGACLVLLLAVGNWLYFGVFDGGAREGGGVASPAAGEVESPHGGNTLLVPGPVLPAYREALSSSDGPDPVALAESLCGLAGRVVDAADGRGIEDVEVTVTGMDPTRTRTDKDGHYQLLDLSPGRFSLFFSRSGWSTALVRDVHVPGGVVQYVNATLERGMEMTVEVVAEDGSGSLAPVAEARVGLHFGGQNAYRFPNGRELQQTGLWGVTGADGRIRFDQASPGVYYAIVQAPGHPGWIDDLSFESDGQLLRVELASGGVIEGQAFASDGTPGQGLVLLAPTERPALPEFLYGRGALELDREGRFRFGGVPSGEHVLGAALTSGESAYVDEFDIDEDETVRVTLRATATGGIRGRVTDPNGRGLVGAEVKLSKPMLHPEVRSFPERPRAVRDYLGGAVVTDAEGRYHLKGVPTAVGNAALSVALDGFGGAQDYPVVRAGVDVQHDVVLSPIDSFVEGVITHASGGPVVGVTVHASVEKGPWEPGSYMALTGSDGRFHIEVPARSGRLRVFSSGRRLSPPGRFEPRGHEHVVPGTRDLDFVLSPRAVLRGRAVDPEGAVVRSLDVHLYDDVDQCFHGRGLTVTSDGAFEVPIDVDRDLYATVCAPGYAPAEVWDLERQLGQEIVVELFANTRELAVRVEDADGSPVAGAGVSLAWHAGRGSYPMRGGTVPSARTDADGQCVLRAVPDAAPEDFLVAADFAHHPPLVQFLAKDVELSGATHVLRLPASREITLFFRTPEGEAAVGRCLVLSADDVPLSPRLFTSLAQSLERDSGDPLRLEDGRLTLSLAPGEYRVVFRLKGSLEGQVSVHTFELEEGQSEYSFSVD